MIIWPTMMSRLSVWEKVLEEKMNIQKNKNNALFIKRIWLSQFRQVEAVTEP
jgi:hypothetical protein